MFRPEGSLLYTQENTRILSNRNLIREACFNGTPVEARALRCDAEHNLHVDLGCMKGVIPRDEGALGIADGSVRDIAVISRVNKPVVFHITGFCSDENGENMAILSRRSVQQQAMEHFAAALHPGDVIDAAVSHIESFGVFCDIGAGINALMPIDSISVSRIPHPGARFAPGQTIKAVVKNMDETGRITLSHKELLGTWAENAAQFAVGETVPGIVRSVEKYGIFVELTPNLAGLAEYTGGITAGCHAGVFIKSILPQKMKIKLIIVDAFAADYPLPPLKYYITGGHIDRWRYSPEGCERVTESIFDPCPDEE